MEIRIYNTLTRKKEVFEPLKKDTASIYACGPTVYDTPHIGNYRTFVMDDILRRVFEYNGYRVILAMNITDVDDKTIRRSKEEAVPLSELTQKYEKLFIEGLASLHVLPPHHLTRATQYVQAMIELTQNLIDKGIAYKADDGVYVSISKVNNYGQLANLDLSEAGHERIANDNYDKDNPRDFAVWKFKTAEDGQISWPAPFGEGRPGWHIECSAMAMKILGPTIDIHTGGTDLIFPHHTNEIAQSESATGQKFANYWIHGGFVNIQDEKMAKSKGNFIKLEDLSAESVSPLAYRYWLLTAHYRSLINFSYDAVRSAQTALIRLIATVAEYPEGGKINSSYKETFQAAINDDLDLPKAIALTWELIKDSEVSDSDKRATILDFDRVFGLSLADAPKAESEAIPPEIQALADAREEARREKDWKKSDALRDEIQSRGYEVKDTDNGPQIRST